MDCISRDLRSLTSMTIAQAQQRGMGGIASGLGTRIDGRLRVDGRSFARQGRQTRLRGVTYGPFAPGGAGYPFPDPGRVAEDFALMREAAVNVIRTYHVPPEWLIELAGERGLGVFIDVPWSKHLCFLRQCPSSR